MTTRSTIGLRVPIMFTKTCPVCHHSFSRNATESISRFFTRRTCSKSCSAVFTSDKRLKAMFARMTEDFNRLNK